MLLMACRRSTQREACKSLSATCKHALARGHGRAGGGLSLHEGGNLWHVAELVDKVGELIKR